MRCRRLVVFIEREQVAYTQLHKKAQYPFTSLPVFSYTSNRVRRMPSNHMYLTDHRQHCLWLWEGYLRSTPYSTYFGHIADSIGNYALFAPLHCAACSFPLESETSFRHLQSTWYILHHISYIIHTSCTIRDILCRSNLRASYSISLYKRKIRREYLQGYRGHRKIPWVQSTVTYDGGADCNTL